MDAEINPSILSTSTVLFKFLFWIYFFKVSPTLPLLKLSATYFTYSALLTKVDVYVVVLVAV